MNRFPGEEVFFVKEKNSKIEKSDEEINTKYKSGEIRIVTEQARYPVKSIPGMVDSDDYNLNPEYQRRKRWDDGKKSRLIESFIMNVPLPPIFLYEYDYSKYEVMDGLQRLTAISDFYKGKFKLVELEYWKELEGKTVEDLPSEIKKGIDRRYISSIVLLEETAKTPEEAEKLKQIVFERLNSGGEKLTPQETRNALYDGEFNQLCIELSKYDNFRKMLKIPLYSTGEEGLLESDLYREMGDVEMVLRFFAYRFIESVDVSITTQTLLDIYIKKADTFDAHLRSLLKQLFIDVVDTIYQMFGDTAFLPPKRERQVKTPQKYIYDPLMQSVAKIIKDKDSLLHNAALIRDDRYKHIKEDDDRFEGRNTKKRAVEKRIQYFDEFFAKYI